jgi:hypothetical protein
LKRRESNCCNEIEREGSFNNTKKKKETEMARLPQKITENREMHHQQQQQQQTL